MPLARVPRTALVLLAGWAFLFPVGCSTPSSQDDSHANSGPAIGLEGGISLVFEDGGSLDAHRTTIERIVKDTVSAVRGLLPVNGVTIQILSGTASVIPEIGMGGFTASTDEIRLTFNPDSTVLPGTLPTELFPLLAHEMHHVARFRTIGYNTSLLDAMVTEGLADQFSVEIADIDPPMWSQALSAAELVTWTAIAREHWLEPTWNHDAWFFGADPSIPRWAGYSIGYEIARTFLSAHPDRRPSQLYGEPARAFLPPDTPS
jgi:uncharacterized protein YjaZ